MTIMVGTTMIPTTPICTFIPEVPIAGVSVWDLDTRDGECPSLLGMADIMADIMVDMVDITPIMVMAIPTMVMAIPIMVMVVDAGEAIPTTEAPTGPDTTMVSTTDIITVVVATIMVIPPDTAGWIAGILLDIQVPAM